MKPKSCSLALPPGYDIDLMVVLGLWNMSGMWELCLGPGLLAILAYQVTAVQAGCARKIRVTEAARANDMWRRQETEPIDAGLGPCPTPPLVDMTPNPRAHSYDTNFLPFRRRVPVWHIAGTIWKV